MVGFNKAGKLENGHFEEKPESNFEIIITCMHTQKWCEIANKEDWNQQTQGIKQAWNTPHVLFIRFLK